MNELGAVLMGVTSTAALACLIMLVMQLTLLNKGDWVYAKLHGRGDITFVQKSYFIFALLGFLICVGAGFYCLLWYLPRNWGGTDEDGEFTPIRIITSVLGALFLGVPLASLVTDTVKLKWVVQRRLEDIDHLEKQAKNRDVEVRLYTTVICAGEDQQQLLCLKDELLKKVDSIIAQKTAFTDDYCGYLDRELHFSQVRRYEELLKTIDHRLELCKEKDRIIEQKARIQELRQTLPAWPPQIL